MALRKIILVEGEIYHIFNRSIQEIPIFKSKRDFNLFLEATQFYLQPKPPVKFSVYRRQRKKYAINLDKKIVTIFAYCFMPNHFHFLLRQEEKKGIQKFVQRLSNSYAHYFSIKYENRGPVFEGNFKAVRVENDEQLVHLSRYIHLNPVTAYLTERPEEYFNSSYRAYLKGANLPFLEVEFILSHFSSPGDYEKFVLAQKGYQRELGQIKHLLFE